AKKEIDISNSTISTLNSVTIAGVEMPVGPLNELIMYRTNFTMDDIDTIEDDPSNPERDLVDVVIGGVPLTAGRIGNEYYLIVSPIENIG
ncbi:hypothetical protein LCGC14_2689160, partial [marine sediment metagenome]